MKRTVGIDLGTTNSAGVVLKDGKMRAVPCDEDYLKHGKMVPSVVAFTHSGEIIVGKKAQDYSYLYPDRVVRWIKRKMGTDYVYSVNGIEYTPQEISAFILRKIKRKAEEFVGEEINRAVITAPAYFNQSQRNATKEAGEIAGFEVLRVVNEPTAASLAYGLGLSEDDLKIAVLDLGAGTFDVTVLSVKDHLFRTLATCGDNFLGGKDFDDAVIDSLLNEINQKDPSGFVLDERDRAVFRDAVEEAKICLSTSTEPQIIPLKHDSEEKQHSVVLNREKIEAATRHIVKRIDAPILHALKDAEVSSSDLDKLILVGGPTLMPSVKDEIRKIISLEPEQGIDPLWTVATGALIQASIIDGEIKNMLLLDVTPLSLGIETKGGVFTRLIPRNTSIPVSISRKFATAKDDQTSMMLHVLQGERELTKGNTSLGLMRIRNIPVAPRYKQEVEVTFQIDADGILHVSAVVLDTGERFSMEVLNPNELNESDIVHMIIEATKFDQYDSSERQKITVKNNAMAVLNESDAILKKNWGQLNDSEKKKYRKIRSKLLNNLDTEPSKLPLLVSNLKQLTEELIKNAKKRIEAKTLFTVVQSKGKNIIDQDIEAKISELNEMSYCEADDLVKNIKMSLILVESERRVANGAE